MPRLSNSLPKYRKHRASGQAMVTLGGVTLSGVTLSGRDHYLGPHGTQTSKREYDGLTGKWLAKGYYVKDGRCTCVVPSFAHE